MNFDSLYETIKSNPGTNVVLKVSNDVLSTMIPNCSNTNIKYCNVVLSEPVAGRGYTKGGVILNDAPVLSGMFFIHHNSNKHISDDDFKVLQRYNKFVDGVAVCSFIAYTDEQTGGIDLLLVCDKDSCGV